MLVRKKALTSFMALSLVTSSLNVFPMAQPIAHADESQGRWMTGDYHVHTFESNDAQQSLKNVLDNALNKYELDWIAMADHLRMSGRDDEGNTLPGEIPMSQGIAQFQAKKIKELQDAGSYAGKTIFTGFEWDMPTLDHAAVGIVTDAPGSEEALKAINQFEYLFSNRAANLFDPADVAKWSAEDARAYTTRDDAKKGFEWLAKHYPDSYALINHPSRKNGSSSELKVEDLRDINNIAPNIAFGFEGMPGNQMAPDRGETTELYGGADVKIAKVGGMWDALLGEGRRFWNFANSDFHFEISGDRKYSSGYWPGEYSKNYTWVEGSGIKAIVEGMRSGKSFSVNGDLINALDFKVEANGSAKEMGEELQASAGDSLQLTIRFKSPDKNNNGDPVQVDHIDLISGEVTGKAQKGTAAYSKATNETAKVLKRFTSADWTTEADGSHTITYDLGSASDNQYFRLRGTNLGTDVFGETSNGEPLIDPKNTTVDNETRFAEINARNYKDMWFYSNPIFVNVAYTDSEAVQEALQSLSVPDSVRSDFTVPLQGKHGATIAWQSSDSALASINGDQVHITRPAIGQPDAKVTLTATAEMGAETDTRTFEVTLKAQDIDGSILWYSFDSANGTTVPDQSGRGNNGTLIGGATVTAQHGGAVQLNGTNGAVQLPNGILSGLTNATFTMSLNVDSSMARPAWLLTFSSAANAVSGTKYMGFLEDGGGKFRASITPNWYVAEQTVSKGSALSRGVWKTIAYSISGTTATLYEDGVQIDQKTGLTVTPKDIEATVANYLGRPAYAGDKYFKGMISDFRIYPRALTAAEVAAVTAEDAAGAVADDKAALTLGDTTAVAGNLTLPTTGAAGSTISWQSSDPAVVAANGTVTRKAEENATVTLTATLAKGSKSDTKSFTLTVLGTGDIEAVGLDAKALTLGSTIISAATLSLPALGGKGSSITWATSDASLIETNGTVHRPAQAANGKITLTATIAKGTAETTKTFPLVVLSQTPVIANWKFDQEHVVSGSLADADLRIGDLSGLGNDLKLVTTGNAQAPEASSMLEWSEDGKSLVFHNFRGASVGKYFKTIDGAPINSETFPNGFTIEVVFKMAEGFTPARNQWSGILTRQGTGKEIGKTSGEPEVLTTLSVSNLKELQWESYPTNGNNNPTAWSFTLDSTKNWYHAAVVNDGHRTKMYIDGVTDFRNPPDEVTGIAAVTGKGWNVGASEYDGKLDGLFAGTIEEIKITANALPQEKWVVQDFDTDGIITGNNDKAPVVSNDQTYSFSFIPDTQNMVRYQPEIFYEEMQWLADFYKKNNIKMAVSLGDIVDQSWVSEQWVVGGKGYDLIDKAGLPYILTRGNHDVGGYGEFTYTNYFGEKRFAGKDYWHGGSPTGTSSYIIVEAGSYKYMVLSIDREEFKKDLSWAQGVLNANKTLPTILLTHETLEIGGDGKLVYSGNGQSVYNDLVKNNNQVFMTIAGHNHGTDYRVVQNASGNDVIEMLVDYQSYYHGGNGWLRMMEMDEANNELTFRTFSPWVDKLTPEERTFFDLTNLTGKGDTFTRSFNFDERFSFYQKVGVVSGTISDGTQPLEGAKVSLNAGGATFSATSGADGSYRLTNVPAGTGYVLSASKAGYQAASQNEVSVVSNQSTAGDLILAPLSSTYYTITFNRNGGDTEANPNGKTAIEGGEVSTLPVPPTKAGSVFKGWNTQPDGSGLAVTETTKVSGDLTVYAQWTDLVLRYTFDNNTANGTMIPDVSGNGHNGTLIGGATLSDQQGGSVLLDGTDDAVRLPNGILAGLQDVTITMNVKADPTMARPAWYFSFASSPNAVSGTKYLGVLEDSQGTFRGALTRNYYVEEQVVTKGSTLEKGVWKSVALTLSGNTATLYENGVSVGQNTGITLTPQEVEATIANYIGRPAYSGDKYFKGSVADFRIYARALAPEEVAAVSAENLAESGSIAGIVTDGKDPVAGALVSLIIGDKTYSAVSAADGSYTLGAIPIGTDYVLTAAKEGYTSGSSEPVNVTANEKTVGAVITLTKLPSNWIVTFDKNGGTTGADPAAVTVLDGTTLGSLPAAPTRAGYSFTGWNTLADGTGTAFTADMVIHFDMIVYAQWKSEQPDVTTGTIIGMITDGKNPIEGAAVSVTVNGSVYSAVTNANGSYTLVDVPAGTGYTVIVNKAGYIGSSAEGIDVAADGITSGIDLVLLPEIQEPIIGSITGTVTDGKNPIEGAAVGVTVNGSVYSAVTNANGGYTIVDIPAGTNYTVMASKNGYVNGSAAGIDVAAGETTSGVNLVLLAAIRTYSVTFDKNGGDTEAAPGSLLVTEGNAVPALPAAPSRAGYRFTGWNTLADGSGTSFTAATLVTANLTVYAQWTGQSTPNPSPTPSPADPYVKPEAIVETPGTVRVDLTQGSTVVSTTQMARLIEQNKDHDIVLNGTDFTLTFPAGTMAALPDAKDYDFRLQFNSGASDDEIRKLAGDAAAVIVNYKHTGTLPGQAVIRVKLGSSYAGQTVYYYYFRESTRKLEFMQSAVVDASGFVTVKQNHFSDYVFTTKRLGSSSGLEGIQTATPNLPGASELTVVPVYTKNGKDILVPFSAMQDGKLTFIGDSSVEYRFVDNAKSFADTTGHWAQNAISFVTARELFQGTAERTFSPNTPMTRAMLITVLGRLWGVENSSAASSRFTDVPANAYYAGYVEWAAQNGIVNGTGAGRFDPNAPVTREQAAVILANFITFAKLPIEGSGKNASSFVDQGKISSWATESVAKLTEANLLQGKGDGTFDPQGQATRAEVATLLKRLIESSLS